MSTGFVVIGLAVLGDSSRGDLVWSGRVKVTLGIDMTGVLVEGGRPTGVTTHWSSNRGSVILATVNASPKVGVWRPKVPVE